MFSRTSAILSWGGGLADTPFGRHPPMGRHPPWADTPHGQTPPMGRHPPSKKRSLQRTVRILLECIPVSYCITAAPSAGQGPCPAQCNWDISPSPLTVEHFKGEFNSFKWSKNGPKWQRKQQSIVSYTMNNTRRFFWPTFRYKTESTQLFKAFPSFIWRIWSNWNVPLDELFMMFSLRR